MDSSPFWLVIAGVVIGTALCVYVFGGWIIKVVEMVAGSL